MGMSLDAYLFFGRPLREDSDADLPELITASPYDGIDFVNWGRDFAGSAIVVKDSLIEAYYGPKLVGEMPAAQASWYRAIDAAIEQMDLSPDDFEPAGWYLAPSYA